MASVRQYRRFRRHTSFRLFAAHRPEPGSHILVIGRIQLHCLFTVFRLSCVCDPHLPQSGPTGPDPENMSLGDASTSASRGALPAPDHCEAK